MKAFPILAALMSVRPSFARVASATPREAQSDSFTIDAGYRLDLSNFVGTGALSLDEVSSLAARSA